jgi:UDP-N-acetylglucosamine transferase subunit ALG13
MSPERASAAGLPLVLVTVGTDHHPFDRLAIWIDEWLTAGAASRARVTMQRGTSRAPAVAESVPLLAHDELERLLSDARAVVCHGGPGTILGCLAAGKKPIVVPRQAALGEHVDDHQVRFSRRLAELDYVRVAESEPVFRELLDSALEGATEFATVARPEDRVAASVAAFERVIAERLGIAARPAGRASRAGSSEDPAAG